MICFRDTTFTKNPLCTCSRLWTTELAIAATKWWGGPGALVAFLDGCSECQEPCTNDPQVTTNTKCQPKKDQNL